VATVDAGAWDATVVPALHLEHRAISAMRRGRWRLGCAAGRAWPRRRTRPRRGREHLVVASGAGERCAAAADADSAGREEQACPRGCPARWEGCRVPQRCVAGGRGGARRRRSHRAHPGRSAPRVCVGSGGTRRGAFPCPPFIRLVGFPSYRSRMTESLVHGPGSTIHVRSASSRRGFGATPTAWTTWSGCDGRVGSSARSAVTPRPGSWLTGAMSAGSATSAPRSRRARSSTARARR